MINQNQDGINKDATQNNDPNICKIVQVCTLLGISKPTVYNHVQKGYYKKYKLGRKIYFHREEILKFLWANSA